MSTPGGDAAASAVGKDQDAFLDFANHAMSVLSPEEEEGKSVAGGGSGEDGYRWESRCPSWSWLVSRILKTCLAYSSGVTPAILLSELFQSWGEQNRYLTSTKRLECLIPLKKKQRTKLPNTVTIDSIYEKNFLSTSSILEAVVVNAFVLPGTDIYMLNLGDIWSSNTIDLYLHCRYYDLVHPDHGILKRGREIFLTGCCLRSGTTGSGRLRLLPTEYLVILLDEDQDEDAMLLGAQFCSDSFSSMSLDTFKEGASYSFYARIMSIGPLEVQGRFGCLQKREVTLADNDGVKLNFILWGDQVLLANLFSIGSMLALDKPFVATTSDRNFEGNGDICLEYGSATQLYLVPFMQLEEQVLLASTQLRYQGSTLPTVPNQSQDTKLSQVSLPRDSQGSVDFRNYPFRLFVIDLQGKMTGISLYGVVTDIQRELDAVATVYSMTVEDVTGAVVVKLHFSRQWSLGRLSIGHTIYITGLTCITTTGSLPEVSWNEKDVGSSIVNMSCLPALLNSSCLHKLSLLSSLSGQTNVTHICRIQILQVEHHHLCSRFLHDVCGHLVNNVLDGSLECNFCRCNCEDEIIRSFHLKVTLQDESARIFAWCMGQTAVEILQISPDDFYELPEVEQGMYLYTLENERFTVALVNSNMRSDGFCNAIDEESEPTWEIARAQKCD